MFWQILTSPTYWRSVFSGDAEIGYLWSIFLKEYGDPFTVGVMALTFVTFAGLVYIALRYRRGALGVVLALVAGVTFVLQMALSASVPALYENTGRGMPHSACPILAFDQDGLLIMEESTIELENGQEVAALVARKNIFTVMADPVLDELDGEERIGLLLTSQGVFGDTFPRYCSILNNEAGQVVLERIEAYSTPIDMSDLKLLLDEQGLPMSVYSQLIFGQIKVKDFAVALEKFVGHDMLPAYASDLQPMLNKAIKQWEEAYNSATDAEAFTITANAIFYELLEEFEKKRFNRAPLISLPGMPPYELLDPQQEGDGESEGEAEGQGEGQGGEGNKDALALLLELLESGAITLDQLNSMTDNETAGSQGSFGGVQLPNITKGDDDRH